MKIVCIFTTSTIEPYLEKLTDQHELDFHQVDKLAKDEIIELAKTAQILIIGPSITKLRRDLLSQLKELKLLALPTIGTDWVDLEYCRENGITVSNIHGATAESVAEHIWAMILDLGKRVSEFDRDARLEGAYNFTLYKGKEVYGKTLGVIGVGSIGSKVARIAKSFDMRVIGVNKSNKSVEGVEMVDKSTLLSESDVIALCIPSNDKTKNYIDHDEIVEMKDGVIIINCAREVIVNKQALLDGIKSGKVFGYGVETSIMQALDKNDEYYKYPNIIVTLHNAFNTVEADMSTYNTIVENIEAYVDGKPQNIVK